jgi:hypothetical protein
MIKKKTKKLSKDFKDIRIKEYYLFFKRNKKIINISIILLLNKLTDYKYQFNKF